MAIKCIVPSEAEKLKKAFKSGDISIVKLFEMSSEARVATLAKLVGKDNALLFVSKLERAYMMPRQKQSMRNVIYEMFGEKPLYQGVSIDNANKMASELSMPDLKKMSVENRANTLSKYMSNNNAQILSQRFEDLKRSGNLAMWEKRAFGTETLRDNKILKGSMAKLEALNDMGVLSPTELDDFMKTFVEDKLKLSLTLEEANKLSEMTTKAEDLFDNINKSNDWTYKNSENITEYFKTLKDIRAFQQDLVPGDISSKINTAIDYARASILASPRILRNSALYQIIPTLERYITKRILPAGIGRKDLSASVDNMMKAKLFGITPSKKANDFMAGQLKMGFNIYKETGFDISRMENLDDGFNLFGGEKFGMQYGTGKKLSDVKGADKLKLAFNKYAEAVINTPKWTAGGTDMTAANLQRADTSIVLSREYAFLEASKKDFKTPEAKNKWISERADELLIDSQSFTPKEPQAQTIRSLGIFDANLSNSTQDGGLGDIVTKLRGQLKIGDVNFGKLIVPFAKIATTTIGRGLQIAGLPFDAAKSFYNINKAASNPDPIEAGKGVSKNISLLVGNIGLALTTIIMASFLDDDDYIGQWDTITYNENRLAQARGAGAGYVRIAGKWIPIRFLPMINIPLAGIMTARQAKARGASGIDVTGSYIAGTLGAILDTPVLKEISDISKKIQKGASSRETVKLLDGLGLDGKSLFEWAKVRTIPSAISYDVWNMMNPADAKYDFLGNQTGKNKMWIGFRADLSNDITFEFNRLNNTGNLPTISDPGNRDALKDELGEKEYYSTLARYKQNYSDRVFELIKTDKYKNLSDENKKKEIDKIRKEEIMDKTK